MILKCPFCRKEHLVHPEGAVVGYIKAGKCPECGLKCTNKVWSAASSMREEVITAKNDLSRAVELRNRYESLWSASSKRVQEFSVVLAELKRGLGLLPQITNAEKHYRRLFGENK